MAGGGYVTTYKPALILGDAGRLAGPTENAPSLRCLGLVFSQCQHPDPETSCAHLRRSRLLGSWGKQSPLDAAGKIQMKNRHWSTLISNKTQHPHFPVSQLSSVDMHVHAHTRSLAGLGNRVHHFLSKLSHLARDAPSPVFSLETDSVFAVHPLGLDVNQVFRFP